MFYIFIKRKISLIFFFKPGMLYKFHVKTTLSEKVIGNHRKIIRSEIISKIILSRNLLIEKFKDGMICNPFKIDRQRSYLYFRENCLETFIGVRLWKTTHVKSVIEWLGWKRGQLSYSINIAVEFKLNWIEYMTVYSFICGMTSAEPNQNLKSLKKEIKGEL